MKLEAVMENIQRQRLRDQQRMKSPVSDDVIKGDDVSHDENGHGDADNRNGGNNIILMITRAVKLGNTRVAR